MNCIICYYYDKKLSSCNINQEEFLQDNNNQKNQKYINFIKLYMQNEIGSYFQKQAKNNKGCEFFLNEKISLR